MIKKHLLSPTLKRIGVLKCGLQARALNALFCICVSGYHYYYYYYYYYYFISTQATSIITRALIGLACVAWASNDLITGRARGTREGERRPPFLFSPHASSTFLLSPLLLPPNKTKQQQQQKLAPATQAMIGPKKETVGDGPGAGR